MFEARTVFCFLTTAAIACSPGEQSEAVELPTRSTPVLASPTGIPLQPREPNAEEVERIRIADEALAADPNNADRIVAAALAREAVWRYNEAIELYSRGVEIAPDDYRMYLGRAHRTIRLRDFEFALADLDRAVELDPYGFNSAYLRGLTLYFLGRFDGAADEYDRCMALANDSTALQLAESGQVPGDPRHCMVVSSDDRSLVAITAWRYRALRRAGRHAEAEELLADTPIEISLSAESMEQYLESTILPGTNEHYYNLLRIYRGQSTESELLDRTRWEEQWPTVAYGMAVWFLVEGDTTRSIELLREIVSDSNWARLGHVAAETDLISLTGTR